MDKIIKNSKYQSPTYKVSAFFPKKNKYCIAIPVINEGNKIRNQLIKMRPYSQITDIIIFDGRSNDGSIDEVFLRKNGVRALIVSPPGQSIQLRAGLEWSLKEGYLGIITIDGNNKDNVNFIPDFIETLEEGYDYIQGSRFLKGGHHENTPLDRLLLARLIISPLLSLSSKYWYTDTPNAFRAYSRKYLLHPEVKIFRNIFVRYELLFYLTIRANNLGLRTKEIPVDRRYPKGKIPTKIVGLKKIFDMINIFRIALGFYNP